MGTYRAGQLAKSLTLGGVFSARAPIGRALNFEQGRDVIRLASKKIVLVSG